MRLTLLYTSLVILAFSLMYSPAVMAQYKPQSPIFGTDVEIYNNTGCDFAQSEIAVAINGYIFVLGRFDLPGSDLQSWNIWCSTDGGLTFSVICGAAYSTVYWELADVDLVVTGNDPSNISVWVAEVANRISDPTVNSFCKITEFDVNGGWLSYPYKIDWGALPDKLYSCSIATDYRSPGSSSDPFTIAVAYAGVKDGYHLIYAYSPDGGLTWSDADIHQEGPTDNIGKVSLALGATLSYNQGYYGVAFDYMGNIGVIVNYTDNSGAWTEPVWVTYLQGSTAGFAHFPSVAMMDNVTANPENPDYFPLIIAYEDHSTAACDIIYHTLSEIYAMNTQASLYDFTTNWIGASNNYSEKEPALCFDKTYNNFLLTYSTTEGNRIPYAWAGIEEIGSGNWNFFNDYRDASAEFTWQVAPKTDIDLKTAKACFSWTEQNPENAHQSILFDSEWSTLGMTEPATASGFFRLIPNPALDEVLVSFSKPGSYEVIVSSLAGQTLIRKTVTDRSNMVDLRELESGIYFVRVSGKVIDVTKKLVIK